jgi:hypothetical protein
VVVPYLPVDGSLLVSENRRREVDSSGTNNALDDAPTFS